VPSSLAKAAVIDIGSNSIKILVAQREADGHLSALKLKTMDARISAGISRQNPMLSDAGIERGIEAVRELLADAREFSPDKTILVATSAVRDAQNGHVFTERIQNLLGHRVRILTGDEEANYIGRGLTCDPALHDLRDFYVFDLGGGSLECLAFRDRHIGQAVSLPLGCVRLTERCVQDPAVPFSKADRDNIAENTRATLAGSGFRFDLPTHATAVGTGGTLTTARAVLAGLRGQPFEQSDTLLPVADLRELFGRVSSLNLEHRRELPAMPYGRADVFPTALATVIALAEVGNFSAYRNSIYNLRWGIAAEALE
jgi:exopolyphosphatase/guanosine-5'-triphosphate,3'-diphosphate pyrophosphatase